ncbi:MAG: hypothetical protein GY765_29765 [bacterium]|nr:hypothetical protein [bacterium]
MHNYEKLMICCFAFLFSLTTAFPQTLPFRHYTTKDGMVGGDVRCIFPDSRGYLWCGTENGLSRFDGAVFRHFQVKDGLLNDYIMDIAEDDNGDLWVCTKEGVSFYNRQEGTWRNYTVKDGLAHNNVFAVANDPGGRLWFGTQEGVNTFDGKTFSKYSDADGYLNGTTYKIIRIGRQQLWFGTDNGAVYYSRGRTLRHTRKEGLADNTVFAPEAGADGRMWFATNNGLSLFRNGKNVPFKFRDTFKGNAVLSVFEDRDGNTWVGTEKGLTVLSADRATKYTTRNGLAGNSVLSLIQDREGNIWLGSGAGLSCLNSTNITNYSVKDGLTSGMVWDIMEDGKGNYWIGTGEGLNYYSKGRFSNYTTADGLIDNTVYSLMEDRQGRIWVGTNRGVSLRSGGTFTNYTTKNGLTNDIVKAFVQDHEGNIWLGTNRGISIFKKKTKATNPHPPSHGDGHPPHGVGIPPSVSSHPPCDGKAFCKLKEIHSKVSDLIEDSERAIWVASESGLYKIFNGKIAAFYTEKSGLPHRSLCSLGEGKNGEIWIGTEKGLSCFHKGTFRHYTTADGLPTDKCFFTRVDNRGHVWIGTIQGLCRYDGIKFKTFNREDGFISNNWNKNACTRTRDGHMLFGSAHGFSRLYPYTIRENIHPPPVFITGMKVFEKSVPFTGAHQFEYNRNHLRFSFSGLSYSVPKKVKYRYRLMDNNEEWLETRERSVVYQVLPPGSYRFQVKAVNNDGYESTEFAEIPFRILSPYWKTWWFQATWVLAVLCLLVFYFLWRVKRTKEKAALEVKEMALQARTRQLVMSQRMELMGTLAAGAVHDLKNLLSIIIGYSQIAADNYDPEDENYQHNEQIKSTAGTAVQVIQQILAFTRHKYDDITEADLSDLLDGILDILKVTQPNEISISRRPPSVPALLSINPTRFQQLVMNLCLNAFHAMPKGGTLTISLSHSDEEPGNESPCEKKIVLEISDTGTGIEEDALSRIFDPLFTTKAHGKGTGLGLFVVKQIIDQYNAEIRVESAISKGTTFRITFFPHRMEPSPVPG